MTLSPVSAPPPEPRRLFEWDQRRTPCISCWQSILWPIDDPEPPMCESCWDRAAEAQAVTDRRYILTEAQVSAIAVEMQRIRQLPRGAGRELFMAALARRYGVTTRTIQRHARVRDLVAVELYGLQALFGRSNNGTPLRRTAWAPISGR